MSPEEQEQWKQLDARLAEDEKKLLATANLVRAGIPMLVSQQMRIDALIDSDTRLYLQHQQTEEALQRLAEAQKVTEQKVSHLADSIQRLIDSWKSGSGAPH